MEVKKIEATEKAQFPNIQEKIQKKKTGTKIAYLISGPLNAKTRNLEPVLAKK